jgi:hypothetical protein
MQLNKKEIIVKYWETKKKLLWIIDKEAWEILQGMEIIIATWEVLCRHQLDMNIQVCKILVEVRKEEKKTD